jgi:AcrR family transcriptional regulator
VWEKAMKEASAQRETNRSARRKPLNPARCEPKRRGRQRSEESEEAILSAITALLRHKPLRDISIEEIARKAGVGKATMYKWWPSKAYIAFDAFSKKLEEMVPICDTGSAERDFKQQLRSLFAFFDTPAGLVLRHFLAEGQVDAEFASLFRDRFIKPRRETIGLIFDRAVERGQIRRGLDREVVLDLIYGPGFYRMLIRHEPLKRNTVDEMVSALFQGLRGTSSKAKRPRRRI